VRGRWRVGLSGVACQTLPSRPSTRIRQAARRSAGISLFCTRLRRARPSSLEISPLPEGGRQRTARSSASSTTAREQSFRAAPAQPTCRMRGKRGGAARMTRHDLTVAGQYGSSPTLYSDAAQIGSTPIEERFKRHVDRTAPQRSDPTGRCRIEIVNIHRAVTRESLVGSTSPGRAALDPDRASAAA